MGELPPFAAEPHRRRQADQSRSQCGLASATREGRVTKGPEEPPVDLMAFADAKLVDFGRGKGQAPPLEETGCCRGAGQWPARRSAKAWRTSTATAAAGVPSCSAWHVGVNQVVSRRPWSVARAGGVAPREARHSGVILPPGRARPRILDADQRKDREARRLASGASGDRPADSERRQTVVAVAASAWPRVLDG